MRCLVIAAVLLFCPAPVMAGPTGEDFLTLCRTNVAACAAAIRAELPSWPEIVIHPPYTKGKKFDRFRCPTHYPDRKLRDVFMSRAHYYGVTGEGQTAGQVIRDVMTLAAPVCAATQGG